jgi:protein-disulfide isomerase
VSNIRQALNVVANISVSILAIVLVVVVLFRDRATLPRSMSAGGAQSLPRQPLTLDGAWLDGNRSAQAVVIEYADFQCPYCRQFAVGTLNDIRRSYIATGKILFVFHSMPLTQLHSFAFRAAVAAECAGREGKFWQLHDGLFAKPENVRVDRWMRLAAVAGIDMQKFTLCLTGSAPLKVRQEMENAEALSIVSTPTFFVGKQRADHLVDAVGRHSGVMSLAEFSAFIKPVVP